MVEGSGTGIESMSSSESSGAPTRVDFGIDLGKHNDLGRVRPFSIACAREMGIDCDLGNDNDLGRVRPFSYHPIQRADHRPPSDSSLLFTHKFIMVGSRDVQ